MPITRVPWTQDQVDNLNAWQKMGLINQTLCGNRDSHPKDKGVLIATKKGWICPYCNFKQNWSHDFMADRRPTLEDKASDENRFG